MATQTPRGNVCPARPASKSMFEPCIPMLYPQTLLPPQAQEPWAVMTQQTTNVGEQENFHLLSVNNRNPCLGLCFKE